MSDTPKGFRDVYWCWLVNEPAFMVYAHDGETQLCGECGGPVTAMPETHTFCVHVTKPVTP